MSVLVDRRELYRVSLAADSTIEIEVRARGGRHSAYATLSDLSLAGASAVFIGREALSLHLRERIHVYFHAASRNLWAPATVRNLLQLPGFTRVGFEFDHRDVLLDRLPASLRGIFNRRSAPRAKNLGLGCDLQGEAGRCTSARLVDLSASGAGILLDPAETPSLAASKQLSLSFQFSELHEPIRMVSHIRNLHTDPEPGGAPHRVGLEFDPSSTPGFKRQREEVCVFVDARHGGAVESARSAQRSPVP